jgi:hypothetical protein
MIYVIRHHHHLRHRLEKRSRSKLSYHFFVLVENDVEKQKKRILIVIFSNLIVQMNLFLYRNSMSIQSLLNIRCLFEIKHHHHHQ